MLRTRNLTLNSTPTLLTIVDGIETPNDFSIQNTHASAYAYIGTSAVSPTNYGHKLYPGQTFSIVLTAYDDLYAVGDSGSTVAVFINEKS
jgi:hypothetical protein